MTKAELRARLKDLPIVDPASAARRNAAIVERITAMEAWRVARVIALYAASAHEPDLSGLWPSRGGRTFCFPRVMGKGITEERLAFFRVDAPEELLESRWGLKEPAGNPDREIAPEVLDLVLVPAVALTARGERMGRGRGHYDRFLTQLRPGAKTVGVCFTERVLPQIPIEPHDRLLDHVVCA